MNMTDTKILEQHLLRLQNWARTTVRYLQLDDPESPLAVPNEWENHINEAIELVRRAL